MIPVNRTARMWSRRRRRGDDVVAAAQREYEATTSQDAPTTSVTSRHTHEAHERVLHSIAGDTDLRSSGMGMATHTTFITTTNNVIDAGRCGYLLDGWCPGHAMSVPHDRWGNPLRGSTNG